MDGFTLIDGVVAGVLLLSAVLAYSRGLMRELLSIAGWVIAAVVAFFFAPGLEPLTREVPVLRDIIGTSCELGVLAAFIGVFAVALIVASIFTPILSGAVQRSALGPVDQGLGFLFGALRGVLLVAVALILYDVVLGGAEGIAMVDKSRSADILGGLTRGLGSWLPEAAPEWIARQYETLTASCG